MQDTDTDGDAWVRRHIETVGPMKLVHDRPWSTVSRVPLRSGSAWFKTCSPAQAFEPSLTGGLWARWPDRVPEVLAFDVDRAWLLLADAGQPLRALDNPPSAWLDILPAYAE